MSRREDMANAEINALLGRGSSFEGKLTFEGTVRIEGSFSGEIHTNDTIVIGQGAEVKAQIFAGTVIVSGGTVIGNIHAKQMIELEKEAKVRGDIETPSLKIEKGVIFVGSSRMENLSQGRPAVGESKESPTPAARVTRA